MLTKTMLGLVTALAVTTSTAAFAQHVTEYRHQPAWRSAPVQLDDYQSFGGEPKSFGAGHMPRAFYDQQQPGYPQSPPGGGGF